MYHVTVSFDALGNIGTLVFGPFDEQPSVSRSGSGEMYFYVEGLVGGRPAEIFVPFDDLIALSTVADDDTAE